MPLAELKLLSIRSSVKNQPILLALALIVILTGLFGRVLGMPLEGAVLLVAVGMAFLVWPALHTANTEYRVMDSSVVAVGGFFAKSEKVFSISGIQEFRIRRTPLQKMFGVGDLEIVHAEGALSFVGIEDPEGVRDKILTLR